MFFVFVLENFIFLIIYINILKNEDNNNNNNNFSWFFNNNNNINNESQSVTGSFECENNHLNCIFKKLFNLNNLKIIQLRSDLRIPSLICEDCSYLENKNGIVFYNDEIIEKCKYSIDCLNKSIRKIFSLESLIASNHIILMEDDIIRNDFHSIENKIMEICDVISFTYGGSSIFIHKRALKKYSNLLNLNTNMNHDTILEEYFNYCKTTKLFFKDAGLKKSIHGYKSKNVFNDVCEMTKCKDYHQKIKKCEDVVGFKIENVKYYFGIWNKHKIYLENEDNNFKNICIESI